MTAPDPTTLDRTHLPELDRALAERPSDASLARVSPRAFGVEIELPIRGWGRFFVIGFLSFWLCGWAAGEGFGLWMLWAALRTLAGFPPEGMSVAGAGGAAAAAGIALFLGVWLSFWTLGGLAAMHETLRLAFGRDLLRVGRERWSVRQAWGPFGRVREFAAADVARVYLRRRGHALVADVGRETVELTALGTDADREWLARLLCAARGLPRADDRLQDRAQVPPSYEVVREADGAVVLRTSARVRAARAGCMSFLALPLNAALVWWLYRLSTEGGSWAGFPIAAAFGLAAIAGTAWFGLGRSEWRFSPAGLERRHRFAGRTRAKHWPAGALALEVHTDSDGDEVFALVVLSGSERVELMSCLNDRQPPHELGLWLARETGWRYEVGRGVEKG